MNRSIGSQNISRNDDSKKESNQLQTGASLVLVIGELRCQYGCEKMEKRW